MAKDREYTIEPGETLATKGGTLLEVLKVFKRLATVRIIKTGPHDTTRWPKRVVAYRCCELERMDRVEA